MSKRQLIDWLIPPVTEEKLETELISNKKFIFMVTVGIVMIALARLFLA